MAQLSLGIAAGGVNIDNINIGSVAASTVLESSSTLYKVESNDEFGVRRHVITGTGFVFDASGTLTGGTVNGYQVTNATGDPILDFNGFVVNASAFMSWARGSDSDLALRSLLFGDDSQVGTSLNEVLRGFTGNDTVSGGDGSDTIDGGAGANYLRGDAGDDSIIGGSGFNDINGNQGNDTISGGSGGEWIVGGKDNDFLGGEGGDDIVLGNIGSDWCDGGDGNDTVRGGQDDDVILGAGGNDWLSGDRGNDTLTGGFGADTFHSFGDAGVDRVTDFNRAQGDRVLLDPGTTYTVSQLSGNVIIDMTGGAQMILVDVQLSSLTGDWIAVG